MGLSLRVAATNVVLVAGAFIWYFLAYSILEQLIATLQTAGQITESETLIVLGVNVTCIAITAIIGSLLADKITKRENTLSTWMLGGIFVSLIPFAWAPSTFTSLVIVSAVFGGYFGLGMPAVMGYFSRSTGHENRGRLGGIIFLIIGLAFYLVQSLAVGNISLASVVLALVQIMSFLLFFQLKTNSPLSSEPKSTHYSAVLSNRSVLLFMIPWFIFNMVNYMTIPVISGLSEGYEFLYALTILENIIMAIVSVATGFLADSKGRKRLAIAGFAMLGVGYAAIGLFQGSFGWYIYTVADGVAWGILDVLFLFTLWGDLAQNQKSEKFYVIGSLPFLFSHFMTRLLMPLIAWVEPVALFSFASFFLFAAVLPLFYAPETLPEKAMKSRDLKSYLEKALKKAQKESEKGQNNHSDKGEEENEKAKSEESPEDEEARKLAEKYY